MTGVVTVFDVNLGAEVRLRVPSPGQAPGLRARLTPSEHQVAR